MVRETKRERERKGKRDRMRERERERDAQMTSKKIISNALTFLHFQRKMIKKF